MSQASDILEKASRIVLKIGSSVLVGSDGLRRDWLEALASEIADLARSDKQIIVVTSGSVAMGCAAMRLKQRPDTLEHVQAAASVGQVALMAAYDAVLAPHNLAPAQILLGPDDLESRRRYLNARGTLEALLSAGFIPVINENDTVATDELRFGDNDRLAGRVAQMTGADLLILLSDVDGLFSGDPDLADGTMFLPHIKTITRDIEAMAGPPDPSSPGSGGMTTKIDAAKIATRSGCDMIVMRGVEPAPLTRLKNSARCTLFSAEGRPLDARRSWIRGLMSPRGFLHLDAGAVAALADQNSLLPAGITSVVGAFNRGDLVALIGPDGKSVGQGLASYSSGEISIVLGKDRAHVAKLLGTATRSAALHKDDLVLF